MPVCCLSVCCMDLRDLVICVLVRLLYRNLVAYQVRSYSVCP